MTDSEKRAKNYADNYVVGDAIIVDLLHKVAFESYQAGATEQKREDVELFLELLRTHFHICMEDGVFRFERFESIIVTAMDDRFPNQYGKEPIDEEELEAEPTILGKEKLKSMPPEFNEVVDRNFWDLI